MQIGRCVGEKTRRCCASATVGCVGKDGETERVTGVDIRVEWILRNVLAAWNWTGCAVKNYPGSSPYVGNHLMVFLPDFGKSNLDGPGVSVLAHFPLRLNLRRNV